MKQFHYQALDNSGSAVNGELAGESESDIQRTLESQGLYPISIKEKQALISFKGLRELRSGTLSLNELEFLTAELSMLLKSGVKIDRCLHILARGNQGSAMGELLAVLSKSIKQGEPLVDSFAQHAGFDDLYVNLVRMGEASGRLDNVFAGLARDLKFRKELKSKIIQALVYPLVIFTVCIVAVLFVFNFIVPQMSSLFSDTDTLPLYTAALIYVADWMQQYQIYLFVSLILGAVAVHWSLKQGGFKIWLDDMMLRLPLLKSAAIQVERIRFNTSMALMLNAGMRVDEAIGLASGSVKNRALRQQLANAKIRVKRGESLSGSLKTSAIYPDFFVSLLEIGEESGDLPPVFDEIASRSRDGFTNWTTRLTSLLEPIMILFMGVVVGGVVVIMLLSIISVNDGF